MPASHRSSTRATKVTTGCETSWPRRAPKKRNKATSAHLHHDEGEIVVLLRIADPVFHLGGNPRADRVGRKVSGLTEQLLQSLLAELFVLRVVRFGDAVGEGEEDVSGAQLDRRFLVVHVREHAD